MPVSSCISTDEPTAGRAHGSSSIRASRSVHGLPEAGLTLLEVIAATAIVLLTVTAVTTVTVTAVRAGGRAENASAADAALLAEAARLRALPFFVPLPLDWPERRETATPSAIGELFPHADVALNVDDARFLDSGERAGAFETSVVVQGLTLQRTAWMARCEASGWHCVALTPLDGWHAWGDGAAPAEALLVRLEASQEPGAPTGLPDAPTGPDDPRARGLTFVLSAQGRPRAVGLETLLDGAAE